MWRFVHDGFTPQTNLVRRDGRHSVLLPVLTSGDASTLSVVSGVRKLMPTIMAGMPKSLTANFLFDQSIFVKASITGVVREGAIAAGLTGLMILMFLGSWRSTLIVVTSIPLSILASISVLYMLGQTLNVMTLGGLSLAVGILVDDATVEIENNHRHMDMGTPLRRGDPRRRRRDRDTRDRGDAVDLHRLRADLFPDRCGRFPVLAAGDGGRLRDARELHPLPDARPDNAAVLDAGGRTVASRAGEPVE